MIRILKSLSKPISDSNQFIQQFEAGILGDEMDFFEWFSLCELRQDILVKIGKLEKAL